MVKWLIILEIKQFLQNNQQAQGGKYFAPIAVPTNFKNTQSSNLKILFDYTNDAASEINPFVKPSGIEFHFESVS